MMNRNIKISLVVTALGLALILGLLLREMAGPSGTDGARVPQNQQTMTIGGAFSLIDQNGRRVTEADFAGRPLLVYFGFTFCPDVCPLSLDIMGAALDILAAKAPEKAARLQPVFISVDPARDTPAQLKNYLSYFHPSLTGLTGSLEEIDAVKRSFRVYAAKAPDNNPAEDTAEDTADGNYNVDHSSLFYLMDGQNRYMAHFTHNMTAEALAAALAKKLD